MRHFMAHFSHATVIQLGCKDGAPSRQMMDQVNGDNYDIEYPFEDSL